MFTECDLPEDLAAVRQLAKVGYQDCYVARTPLGTKSISVDLLARLFFSDAMPSWIRKAVGVQVKAQARSGKPEPDWNLADPKDTRPIRIGDKIGPWRVVDRTPTEIVFRENAWHLDFVFAIEVSTTAISGETEIHAATLVQFHRFAGALYFLPVRPFHRWLVPRHMDAVLRCALRDNS
ncbi:MAG: hypothetical protein RL173_2106 [Fibrobacterota bacterium]|jgi:hypothetical protein